jgi:hypothetical protein
MTGIAAIPAGDRHRRRGAGRFRKSSSGLRDFFKKTAVAAVASIAGSGIVQ